MATTPTKPTIEVDATLRAARVPSWPLQRRAFAREQGIPYDGASHEAAVHQTSDLRPSGRDALQALLAFSAMHQQVRQRRALASRRNGFETVAQANEFEPREQFVLDEVLQLVAERAIAITGADGLGIALAENNEIVLRASAGAIKPDVGQRIQRDSAFSGACFRTAQIIRCDDTETDDRVNLSACRQLRARSMVAVPLCGRRRVIGLLEAFSSEPFGFNDSDVGSLELLAELILGALKPEDEERFAESAQVAEAELAAPPVTAQATLPFEQASSEIAAAVIAPAPQDEDHAKPASQNTAAVVAPPIVVPAVVPSLFRPSCPVVLSQRFFLCACDELSTEPEEAIENATVPLEPEHSAGHHPGIVLGCAGRGLCAARWWTMAEIKNAQLSKVMVKPERG